MVRRFGREINADPNMAQIYVNKGLAEFSDEPKQNRFSNFVSEKMKEVKAFFRETIFPDSIIPV